MGDPLHPKYLTATPFVVPRQSTAYQVEVTYGGDLEPCLELVRTVGDESGFHVELRVAHDGEHNVADVVLRSATTGSWAQVLQDLNNVQQFATELGLYAD